MSYNKVGYPKTGFTSARTTVAAGAAGTTVFMDEVVVTKGPNFASGGGAANALVATITSIVAGVNSHAGNTIPETGTCVILKTAYALQAGANTFNLNSHGADSIVSQHNNATNIETIIAAGAMLELIFDGTNWQAVGY
jgi:hypothetical protein